MASGRELRGEWTACKRCYEREKNYLDKDQVDEHPLRHGSVIAVTKSQISASATEAESTSDTQTVKNSKTDAFDGLDPLSLFAAEETKHPLISTPANQNDQIAGMSYKDESVEGEGFLEPWANKRSGILNKYTTSEKLSITTSFLTTSEKDKFVIKQQTTVTDKVQHRLEQLDDFEEGSIKEMLNLSQQDYVKRIEELNQALISAWEADHRVKALKIAIQCAKLLADISVIQFYPSKFVLVTDILDTFGRLVYERIFRKASIFLPGSNVPTMLPEDFTPDQVPDSAKETCRNWFYKIASIRELVPRFYVEMAILKCYNFLTTGEFSQALVRLTKMVTGIGDSLVAVYARTYICRVGILVAPDVREHLTENLFHFINCYQQLQSDTAQNILAVQRLEMSQYLQLYPPALDWILQCIACRTPETSLTDILNRCKQECNSALLLNSVITAFKPQYIAARSIQFTELIRNCEEAGFPKIIICTEMCTEPDVKNVDDLRPEPERSSVRHGDKNLNADSEAILQRICRLMKTVCADHGELFSMEHHLYRSLGVNLSHCDPPEEQRLQILSEVWKVVMKLKDPTDYISCAEAWVEYPCKHFTNREVNSLLGDVIKHMSADRAFEQHYPQLLNVMSKLLTHMHNFSVLVSMDNFLPFLDMFQKESVKVEACKLIMEAFAKWQLEPTNDPVIVNAMLFVCKTMHDSVNALTLEDERRAIGLLITEFLKKIDFGRDFEKQLDFFVDVRASFSNLDIVLVMLVQSVNSLAMRTRTIVNGNHSRKTASFTRACAAYCFITIPSIMDIFTRLKLYLLSGQVAMANQALSQADAFFKAAISLIQEVPRSVEVDYKLKSSESYLISFLNSFFSTLLVAPDNPEQGVLYLVRGLLNMVQDYTWEPQSDGKMTVYLNAIGLLSAMCQETFLYHIDKVDSNDRLYGCDVKFIEEVNKLIETLKDSVFDHLKNLSAGEALKRQAAIAIGFFNRMVCHGDLSDSQLADLSLNLWSLAQRHGYGNTKYTARTLEYVKRKGGSGHLPFLDLSEKMHLQSRA